MKKEVDFVFRCCILIIMRHATNTRRNEMTNEEIKNEKDMMSLARITAQEMKRDKIDVVFCKMITDGEDVRTLVEAYVDAAIKRFQQFQYTMRTNTELKDAFDRYCLDGLLKG